MLTSQALKMRAGPIASSLLKSDLFLGGTGSYGLNRFGALLLFSGASRVALCEESLVDRRPPFVASQA